MVDASDHIVNGWSMPIGPTDYALPTIYETKATWTSESCADHPDPARLSMRLWTPRVLWPALDFEDGHNLRLFVRADGIEDGTGNTIRKHVAYFEGEVEGVEIHPTRGEGFAARPVRVSHISSSNGAGRVEFDEGRGMVRVTNGSSEQNDTVWVRLWFPAPAVSGVAATSGRAYGGAGLTVRGLWHKAPGSTAWATSVWIAGTDGGGWNVHTVKSPPVGGEMWVDVACVDMGPNEVREYAFVGVEKGTGRPEGYEVLVVGGDMLAKMGRTYIGAQVWSAQTCAVRLWWHLGDALEGKGITFDWYPRNFFADEPGGAALMESVRVRPRDVDNASALEVYRDTVASVGRVALGLAGRVGISWGLKPALRTQVVNGTITKFEDVQGVSMLPASAVPVSPVGKSIDKLTTRMSIKFYNPGPDYPGKPTDVKERVQYVEDAEAVKRYGVVNRTVETEAWTEDAALDSAAVAPNLAVKLQQMLAAQAWSEWYFTDSTTYLSDRLDEVRGLAELVDNASRFGRLFYFDGLDDATPVGRYHRMKGGAFGYKDGKWELEIESEPGNHSGVDSVQFVDVQNSSTTIGHLKGAASFTVNDVRSVQNL